ncbi:MAG TPA: M50 family metallopeptidase [Candidatus Nanoarchaeia archaeon]|nr:M50 family metallopeptidase [Candidatus Nanoarchaeia archaeon]
MTIVNKDNLKKIFFFALILSVVFGYNDKSETFIFNNWLINFILIYIFSFISIFIHEFGHLFAAYLLGCKLSLRLIGLRRYYLATKSYLKNSFKAGLIMPILVTIFSNGALYLTTISDYNVKEDKHRRIGKKFPRISEWELAKIAVLGPVFSILLAVIFKILNITILSVSPVTMNIWIAVLNILPLPLLDGYKTFIYSKLLFAISILFIFITALLLNNFGGISAFFYSLSLAVIFFFLYMLYPHIKK